MYKKEEEELMEPLLDKSQKKTGTQGTSLNNDEGSEDASQASGNNDNANHLSRIYTVSI